MTMLCNHPGWPHNPVPGAARMKLIRLHSYLCQVCGAVWDCNICGSHPPEETALPISEGLVAELEAIVAEHLERRD